MKPLYILVLAAGQGTRMKSTLPKVLHPVGGRPLLEHVLKTAGLLRSRELAVVLGVERERVQQALADREMKLDVTEPAKVLLAQRGYDPVYGARPLRREIQKQVENAIASSLLRGELKDGDTIHVDAVDGQIKLSLRVPEEAAV